MSKSSDKARAIDVLKTKLPTGSEVDMKIMSVARSDMSRQRRVTIKGQDWPKDFNVAKALGLRQGRRGVVVP